MTRQGAVQRLRRLRLSLMGVSVDRSCHLHGQITFGPDFVAQRKGTIEIGRECEIGEGAHFNPWGGSIRLGRRVFIGPYVVIYGHGGVEIGDETLVSMHCRILSSNHAIPPPGNIIRNEPDIVARTRIGSNCWLGAGVTALAGVEIGDGAVIGAGAVVTKDVPENAVAMGIPAKVVRQR